MKTFQRENREYVPRVDLQTYATALSQLQQKHDETVVAKSAYETEIAKLPFNESEEFYRQQLVTELNKTWEESLVNGSASFAYNNLITKATQIINSPETRGKLADQQAYLEFKTNIKERLAKGEITEKTKKWALAYNQYKSRTINNGKNEYISGENAWKPNIIPVNDISIGNLIVTAVDKIKTDTHAWSSNKYLLSDGTTYTSSILEAYKDAQDNNLNYITTVSEEGVTDKLSSKEIIDYVKAYINSDDSIRASVNQQFEVNKWDSEQSENNNDEYKINNPLFIKDSNANYIKVENVEEYLNNCLNPLATQAAYTRNQYKKIENIHKIMTEDENSGKTGKGSNGIKENNPRYSEVVIGGESLLLRTTISNYSNAKSNYKKTIGSAQTFINNTLGLENVSISSNISPDEFLSKMKQSYNDYKNTTTDDETTKNNKLQKYSANMLNWYMEAVNYGLTYKECIDKYCKNKDELEYYTTFTNGEAGELTRRVINNMGKEFSHININTRVPVPDEIYEEYKDLFTFKKYKDDNNIEKYYIDVTDDTDIYNLGKLIVTYDLYGQGAWPVGDFNLAVPKLPDINDEYNLKSINCIINAYTAINDDYYNNIVENLKFNTEEKDLYGYNAINLGIEDIQNRYNRGELSSTDYNTLIKTYNDNLQNLITSGDLSKKVIYKLNDKGVLEQVTNKSDAESHIRQASTDGNINYTFTSYPLLKPGSTLSITYKDGTETKQETFFIEDLNINDEATQNYLNSQYYISTKRMLDAGASENSVILNNGNFVRDLGYIGYSPNLKEDDFSNLETTFNVTFNGKIYKNLSSEQTAAFDKAISDYLNMYITALGSDKIILNSADNKKLQKVINATVDEQCQEYAAYILQSLGEIYGGEQSVDKLATQLKNALPYGFIQSVN